MKRIIAIILSFIIIVSACVCASAANIDRTVTGEKVVITDGDWAYTKVSNYGYQIDSYLGSAANVTIPLSFAREYVTSIGDFAFNENSTLTTLTTTGRIESIGSYAFNGCASLKTVKLYDSLTTLGVGCFYGDSSLNKINVLDTKITSVPAYCFAECGITHMALPDTCESIGHYAFLNCSNLRKIQIPDSVTSIADTAFTGCDNLLIVCNPGSYAAQYAEANGLNYATSDTFVLGDADGNNKVTIRDVTFIQLYLVGLQTLDETAYIRADVNCDGNVNIRDVTYIQMYRAELIDSFYNI